MKIERRDFDIEYRDLEEFLDINAARFAKMFDKAYKLDIKNYYCSEKIFGTDFSGLYQKFKDEIERDEYDSGLADLRKLVQIGLEKWVEAKGLSLNLDEKDMTISKIVSRIKGLSKDKLVDQTFLFWSMAFTEVANPSTHRIFPSDQDLFEQRTEDRVVITLYLGLQIISEIESSLNPDTGRI